MSYDAKLMLMSYDAMSFRLSLFDVTLWWCNKVRQLLNANPNVTKSGLNHKFDFHQLNVISIYIRLKTNRITRKIYRRYKADKIRALCILKANLKIKRETEGLCLTAFDSSPVRERRDRQLSNLLNSVESTGQWSDSILFN